MTTDNNISSQRVFEYFNGLNPKFGFSAFYAYQINHSLVKFDVVLFNYAKLPPTSVTKPFATCTKELTYPIILH